MPYQLGVTIRAPVAAGRVAELRDWLAETGRKGLAEGPFDFTRLHGLHFAKLYLLDETVDLAGRPIPASLVFMSEVDAPLRRHLAELADVAQGGIDEAFQHCTGYPGPGARRRQRIAWLRRHRVRASAFYVNTVGRGVEQIRQEARLREALEDYLDRRDRTGRTATKVRRELQAYVAGRAELAWAMKPPAPPSLFRPCSCSRCRCCFWSCRSGPCCSGWTSATTARSRSGRRCGTSRTSAATRTSARRTHSRWPASSGPAVCGS